MNNFVCTKCGSVNTYIKENGNQAGLYCGDCGKWIKWLNKEEKRLFERFKDEVVEEDEETLSEQEIKQIKRLIKSIKNDVRELEEILGYE